MDKLKQLAAKYYPVLIYLFLLAGIIARLHLYIDNRNLMIDESNVARNIFERNFIGLCKPLFYEQYAPPVFLWLVKLSAMIAGMGEKALRFTSLAAGIGTLLMFLRVSKKLHIYTSAWYPFGLLCLGFIYIEYSTELKQYMLDALICLTLINFALSININENRASRFGLKWITIGTIAIWACMPSIFVLAAVFMYYCTLVIQQKQYKYLKLLTGISAVWLLQFVFYYIVILEPQANSHYLQNFHKNYFFDFKNWNIITDLIKHASGYQILYYVLNLVLFYIAIVLMIPRRLAELFLILMPVLFMIFASVLHQYTLLYRVTLFSMPLFLLLLGIGLHKLSAVKYLNIVIGLAALASIYTFSNFNKYYYEEITGALDQLKEHHIKGKQVFVHGTAEAAYIYYTQMHPGKTKYSSIKDGNYVGWSADYRNLDNGNSDTTAYIFGSIGSKEGFNNFQSLLNEKLHQVYKWKDDRTGRTFLLIYRK